MHFPVSCVHSLRSALGRTVLECRLIRDHSHCLIEGTGCSSCWWIVSCPSTGLILDHPSSGLVTQTLDMQYARRLLANNSQQLPHRPAGIENVCVMGGLSLGHRVPVWVVVSVETAGDGGGMTIISRAGLARSSPWSPTRHEASLEAARSCAGSPSLLFRPCFFLWSFPRLRLLLRLPIKEELSTQGGAE
ncbi:hypothetical protein ElyMa_003515300 [Elysia marginata]|uniref:Uncharacterized protein n=1 Tax=Elysia marginata TaxID=1093978 RepID=A0AAV4EFI7_9GAST|nr:hypothetical protein ElyMa_003515300 [Elysia marginata]